MGCVRNGIGSLFCFTATGSRRLCKYKNTNIDKMVFIRVNMKLIDKNVRYEDGYWELDTVQVTALTLVNIMRERT